MLARQLIAGFESLRLRAQSRALSGDDEENGCAVPDSRHGRCFNATISHPRSQIIVGEVKKRVELECCPS